MQETPLLLDPMSEILFLSTGKATKNIIVTALEVQGPFEASALTIAAERAAEKFPQVRRSIRQVKVGMKFELHWDHRPELKVPVTFSEMPEAERDAPFLERFLKHLSPRLERDWNLFDEVAAEIHMVKVGEDHHVLTCLFHHIAADAGTAAEFGKEIFSHYHQIVTGEKPHWAQESVAVSSSRKRKVIPRKVSLREFFADFRRDMTRLAQKPELLSGSGKAGDTRQHHVKRILTAEQTERLAQVSSGNGASSVDLLTAALNLAVDQWNSVRGITPGVVTTSLSVNLRGRFEGYGPTNNSSLIFFSTTPEERKDPAQLTRSLALTRIRHFRKQEDLKWLRNTVKGLKALSYFPVHIKRKIVGFFANRHEFTVAIGVLGVLWPKLKNGKPTAESFLTTTGNLTVTEVHGMGYKLLSNTRVLLIVYAFDNKLNLILSTSASIFNREETSSFLNLVVRNLLESPQQVDSPRPIARNNRPDGT